MSVVAAGVGVVAVVVADVVGVAVGFLLSLFFLVASDVVVCVDCCRWCRCCPVVVADVICVAVVVVVIVVVVVVAADCVKVADDVGVGNCC